MSEHVHVTVRASTLDRRSVEDLAARLRDLGKRQQAVRARELCEEARDVLLRLDDRLLGAMTAQERSGADLGAERARASLLAANQCDGPKVGDEHGNFQCRTLVELRARVMAVVEKLEAVDNFDKYSVEDVFCNTRADLLLALDPVR